MITNKSKNLQFFLFVILLLNTTLYLSSCSSKGTVDSVPVEVAPEGGDSDPAPTRLSLTKTVPIGSNSWLVGDPEKDRDIISKEGIHNWQSLNDVINTYVKTGSGKLNVGLKMKSSDGESKINVTINGVTKTIDIKNTSYEIVDVGIFDVTEGYVKIEIQGNSKKGTYIGDINEILFGGTAVATTLNFVPDTNDYFGRRGPSVHMGYKLPNGKDTKWFYNEVTVTEGQDKLGTFFMVNGHSNGYFGMQVNSSTERRVLFSVWSAYVTDDPNQIPKDYKVTNLGNGPGVTVQDFGNEGSGLQSFKNANWKAGTTYKFLLKGEPASVEGSTDYTGYFFDPEVGEWELIASLRRPKTTTYIKRTHSFLENFIPSTGNQERKVKYGNQWAYTTEGNWIELNEGTYTADATASEGDRFDYAGGTEGNSFYLRNCGFFNDNVTPNTLFTRSLNGTAPIIDFSKLPVPTILATPKDVNILNNSSWTLDSFSTQEDKGGEGSTGRAADIIDGKLDTFWHSCWSGGCVATAPHNLIVNMGSEQTVEGLQFFQRQNLSRTIKTLDIEISSDKTTWTSLGSFTLENSKLAQNIDFNAPKTFRYFKIIARASHDGTENAALAEVKAYTY
ncbi:DUF3472 domain-containing protein [Polaribacter haliotis]|uniref:DUF3472 domain-containing protein n=1 Tax=Polaribacter haliotis TaxID=1888915 RepID=A0A7L8AK14_9FLAO|nr:DUF3472 domain-containing protein [Polaribacter haliotis]QOD62342.1 DUF3472 domain-containing protein [Polaribacter haliotis]